MTEEERYRDKIDSITKLITFKNARRLSARTHKRLPNWVFAADLFGLGSTYAMALCREMGIDPNATK